MGLSQTRVCVRRQIGRQIAGFLLSKPSFRIEFNGKRHLKPHLELVLRAQGRFDAPDQPLSQGRARRRPRDTLLRQPPGRLLAKVSVGLLWRAAAALFAFGVTVGGAGFWIGDRLASSHEASLNLQIETLNRSLDQARTDLSATRARAAKLETDKRHDEIFLTTYLRYLMARDGLDPSDLTIAQCQFIRLQVEMYRNQLGLNPDPGLLHKKLGSLPSDASVPIEPYGSFRIPPDIQKIVVEKATGAGSGNVCSG
jgi:hypothetical protein